MDLRVCKYMRHTDSAIGGVGHRSCALGIYVDPTSMMRAWRVLNWIGERGMVARGCIWDHRARQRRIQSRCGRDVGAGYKATDGSEQDTFQCGVDIQYIQSRAPHHAARISFFTVTP